jgi:hypothetical protein
MHMRCPYMERKSYIYDNDVRAFQGRSGLHEPTTTKVAGIVLDRSILS